MTAIAAALDTLGLLDLMLWLRLRVPRRTLTILSYHRVARPGEVGELDAEVVEVEPHELAQQLAIVRRYATIVTCADIVRFLEGKPLPPNPVMVTFDDAYVDAHDVALPILRRAGVAATFFIPTAFPDGGRLPWWDRVALVVQRCTRDTIELAYPAAATLHPRRDPRAAAAAVRRIVRAARGLDLERLWDELERVTGVVLDATEERALAARHLMSWRQVRALVDAGMEVESHSHAHLALDTLDPDAALDDLVRSRDLLREAAGVDTRCLAYPACSDWGYDDGDAAVRAGFVLGLTHATGTCRLDQFDPLRVPRVAMNTSRTGAAYKLALLEAG